MTLLEQFVEFFEKNSRKRITHNQYQIAKAIFSTNEGTTMFCGGGRRGGKTAFLTALEAFAHYREKELCGSVVPPPMEPKPPEPPKE